MDAKAWGILMRKAALFAAIVIAATFSTTTVNAQGKGKKPDPAIAAQTNTAKLMAAAVNPGAPQAAAKTKGKKVAKKGGKKKKKA